MAIPSHRISQRLDGGRRCGYLQVGEAPALAQAGEVARELHGVRLVDRCGRFDHAGGGWCGFLARTLARSHLLQGGSDGLVSQMAGTGAGTLCPWPRVFSSVGVGQPGFAVLFLSLPDPPTGAHAFISVCRCAQGSIQAQNTTNLWRWRGAGLLLLTQAWLSTPSRLAACGLCYGEPFVGASRHSPNWAGRDPDI